MKTLSFWKKSLYSALIFFGTLIVLSIGYTLVGNLSTADKVSPGSVLSSASWNRIVDGVLDLDTRLSNFSFAGGNVGIGTTTPGVKLEVAWTVSSLNTSNANNRHLIFNGYNGNTWDIYGGHGTNGYFGISENQGTPYLAISTTPWNVGNVGIGTTSPNARLNIGAGSNGNALEISNTSLSGRKSWLFYNVSNGTDTDLRIWENATTGSNDRMTFRAGGNVGIGTVIPSYTLHVNGTAAGTSWTNLSDRRFKKNITPLSSALDTVEKLHGVTFDWRVGEFKDRNFPKGKQVGFIAQEVEKVIPEVVTTDKQGYKGVEYANITAVLVEAVKELSHKIDELFAKYIDQQKEIDSLKVRLDRLEQK